MNAECALFGNTVFALRGAKEFSVVKEETPEGRDQFPGPQFASLVCRAFSDAEARLLAVGDGLWDVSSEEEVLPPDGHLLP